MFIPAFIRLDPMQPKFENQVPSPRTRALPYPCRTIATVPLPYWPMDIVYVTSVDILTDVTVQAQPMSARSTELYATIA